MRPPKGVLLDTNVLLWVLLDSRRVGKRLRSILTSEVPVFFSAVSMVEIAIKSAQGKFPLQDNMAEDIQALGFRELPLDARSAEQVARFPALEGHDPFDRMLVAQATTHSIPLETADEKLLELGIPEVRDARV
ncbi:MAG: hypothetical protein RL247_925 [Actinomycetota bacterium]